MHKSEQSVTSQNIRSPGCLLDRAISPTASYPVAGAAQVATAGGAGAGAAPCMSVTSYLCTHISIRGAVQNWATERQMGMDSLQTEQKGTDEQQEMWAVFRNG